MNIKRAAWMGLLVYLCSFIAGIIIASAIGFDITAAVEPPNSLWYVGIVATIIIMFLFTLWYFKDKKIKQNPKEGFFFGLSAIVIGFIIDLIFFGIYSISNENASDLLSYYTNPLFWVILVLILVTASAVGYWKQKK